MYVPCNRLTGVATVTEGGGALADSQLQVRMTFRLFCFSHRHFLFKQGSGSSALLSGAGQGYPLTSGTVYSPPPRPLPRSSVTRPLFTFNKPHRCCNWKCTALSASLLTLTLALLLTYVIGELPCTSASAQEPVCLV